MKQRLHSALTASLVLCACLLPVSLLANAARGSPPPPPAVAAATFIWLEKPTATNFPDNPGWDILSEKRAPAVMNVKDASRASSFFIEYTFTVPPPLSAAPASAPASASATAPAAAPWHLWGRTYDPGWSSPARWRLDDTPWQTWQPGPAADRSVFNKTFVMQWHPWTTITTAATTAAAPLELTPGEHRIRIELTGVRKRGDIPFFVLDALLLTRSDFTPKGADKPDTVIEKQRQLTRALATRLPAAEAAAFNAHADDIARRALSENPGALAEFTPLNDEIDRAIERQTLIAANTQSPLHGKITGLRLAPPDDSPPSGTERRLTLKVTWNRAWTGSRLWLGFTQNRALYASQLHPAPATREQTITTLLPAGLPAGHITLQLVPIDQPVATTATATFDLPVAAANTPPLARAWGIYRESKSLRAHPWHVSDGGMMLWDGEPYLPVGGMVNTSNTWRTWKGDPDDSTINRDATALLRSQFRVLRDYGIRDIYFNAFFVRSNPGALAATINAAEQAGMRYGLHVSSVPSYRSLGYHPAPPEEIPAGATTWTIRATTDTADLRPRHRVLWALFDENNTLQEKGSGTLTPRPAATPDGNPGGKGQNKTDLTLDLRFHAAATGKRTLVYAPQLVANRQDVIGYTAGLDDYIADLRETCGSLSYGPGLRLWIDPFQNELHARPVSIYTDAPVRRAWEHWLHDRYGSIDALNAAWQPRRPDSRLQNFSQATRLVPLRETADTVHWLDIETLAHHAFAGGNGGGNSPSPSLRDYKLFRGHHAQQTISRVSDVLKTIANVPVILKHNTFFNDWFINPAPAGGQDGLGYEPYCYGDSLAYHNSLIPYAQAIASGRRQWTLVTETSAAAFDGQKNYVGYLDRIQLLHDFDQMLKFGAKGIYTFGFAFDPPRNFQVSELLRDPCQLEWLATWQKTLVAAPRLAAWLPEVHGWYPAYLREREIVSGKPHPYVMHGNYTQRVAQMRMAPDGRWIVPAMHLDAPWKSVLVATGLLTAAERTALRNAPPSLLKYELPNPASLKSELPDLKSPAPPSPGAAPAAPATPPLDGFTANGIGLIPPAPAWMTLDQFRETILGYRVFQTESLNGHTLPDGRLLVWTCVERNRADLRLPPGATATNLTGKPLAPRKISAHENRLTLNRPPREQKTGDLPDYLAHQPKGYHHPDTGQPEAAILSGVTVEQLLAAHAPAWQRWLPAGVTPTQVAAWREAEQPDETTFVQPRIEGYSRYSGPGGAAIGMNTYFNPPAGKTWHARYALRTTGPGNADTFWLRRMDHPAMDLEIRIDGKRAGTIPAAEKPSDALHLNPWNAGIGVNNMTVGWHRLALSPPLPPGAHQLEIIARPGDTGALKADTQLLGGQSDAATEAEAAAITGLQCVQIDALMLTRQESIP
ncbi:MAG: hypothetical protein LBK99_22465 [Opitutaceae bacterium]|jgi:hypothetical protein|nr:hypothetical protein [Opitutaceae bacterium]